jgi:hypothetical protein
MLYSLFTDVIPMEFQCGECLCEEESE